MTNLVHWTPMRELERFFDDDFGFRSLRLAHVPAVDLYETENNVVAEVSIPGMDPQKIQVEIENNVLHIRSDEETVQEDKTADYYRKEVRRGSFSRSMALPVEVEAEKVTAKSERGILTITMPKSERAKPRKVNVEIK